MSVKRPLAFHLGETWGVDFPTKDDEGNALPLGGATVTWRLSRETREGRVLVQEWTLGDGLTANTPTNGIVAMDITPEMQFDAGVQPGRHWHELKVVMPDDRESVQVIGPFKVDSSLHVTAIPPAPDGYAYVVDEDGTYIVDDITGEYLVQQVEEE